MSSSRQIVLFSIALVLVAILCVQVWGFDLNDEDCRIRNPPRFGKRAAMRKPPRFGKRGDVNANDQDFVSEDDSKNFPDDLFYARVRRAIRCLRSKQRRQSKSTMAEVPSGLSTPSPVQRATRILKRYLMLAAAQKLRQHGDESRMQTSAQPRNSLSNLDWILYRPYRASRWQPEFEEKRK